MNCDECQEQIFDLIERESVDAAGVREILSRCSDCRKDFDRLKAAIALAKGLPHEEPPADVDALIAEVAKARTPTEGAAATRTDASSRFQPVPWAIAAVALLGIGLGYSQSQLWGSEDEARVANYDPAPASEGASATEEEVIPEIRAGEADRHEERADATDSAAKPKAPVAATAVARSRPAEPKRAKKAAATGALLAPDVDANQALRGQAVGTAPADAAAPAPQAAMAERAFADEAADDADMRAKKEDVETGAAEDLRDCHRRVRAERKRAARGADDLPDAETQLVLGQCYARLGKMTEARLWLGRAASHPETAPRAKAALAALE